MKWGFERADEEVTVNHSSGSAEVTELNPCFHRDLVWGQDAAAF